MQTRDFETPAGVDLPRQRRADEHPTQMLVSRAVEAGDPTPLDADAVLHMQRSSGNASVVQLLDEDGSQPDVVPHEAGQPLEPGIRRSMERSFGHDFGDVRVHTDGRSGDAASSVNAIAYTLGNDIVFDRGHYNPSSPEGRHTIAHELTHVVQQRSGPVEGSPGPGGVRVSDPSDRFERAASSTADAILGRLQRQTPDEEDEPIQSLQRAGVKIPGAEGDEIGDEEGEEEARAGVQSLQRAGVTTPGAAGAEIGEDEGEEEEAQAGLQSLQRETPEEEEEKKLES